jgi:hypothetical protein
MSDARGTAVPSWFWIVAGLALLWEAFGCYTYVSQSLVPTRSAWAATRRWRAGNGACLRSPCGRG